MAKATSTPAIRRRLPEFRVEDLADQQLITQKLNELVRVLSSDFQQLDTLDDVVISGIADNDLLQYDATSKRWVNRTFATSGMDARYVNVSGDTMTGALLLADGLVGSPALAFSADTNTGLYRIGADTLGFAAGGSERVRIAGADVGIGGTPTAGSKLHVVNDTTTPARLVGNAASTNFLIGNTASGDAQLVVDGSNGDGAGGDYLVLAHENALEGMLKTVGAQPLKFGTTNIERLRINTQGDLIFNEVGTVKLELLSRDSLGEAIVGTDSAHDLVFRTGNVEVARLTNGTENFLIGTTTDAGQRLRVNGTSEFLNTLFVSSGASLQLTGVAGPGNYIMANLYEIAGGWARGLDLRSDDATRIAGVGLLGSGATSSRLYMGFGASPWSSGDGIYVDTNSNIGLGSTGSFAAGQRVIFIPNATVVPPNTPSGGGILYSQAGALKWKGSSGTVTTIANA